MNDTFKALPLNDCVLKPSRIDIWQYPLHTEFEGAFALLSKDESARAKRYHFARHQRRFTVARATLRLILARYVGLSAEKLVFTYNPQGKPALIHASNIQFNLSHSGEIAILAIGQEHPLGIDIEYFSGRPYEGIAKNLFSPREKIALSQASTALKPLIFFHIWAQKEALIKACGLGLSYPTEQFDVPSLPEVTPTIEDKLHQKTWHMRSFMPEVACSGALCHNPLVEEVRYLKLGSVGLTIEKIKPRGGAYK